MVLESLELLQNSPENGQVAEEATSGYQPGELLQTQSSVDLNDTSEDEFQEDISSFNDSVPLCQTVIIPCI